MQKSISMAKFRFKGLLSFYILGLFLCTIYPPSLSAPASRYQLERGQNITGNETLVSPEGTFALGFFNPANASSPKARNLYLGIWYNNIPNRTVVWIANREQPITDSAAILTVTDDGNIALLDSRGSSPWSSNVSGLTNVTVAMLLESGNFVLRQENNEDVWQSFDYPTDNFLPTMKLTCDENTGVGHKLVAWRNVDDPSPGDLAFAFHSLQLFLWRGREIYYRSGVFVGNFEMWAIDEGVPYIFHVSHDRNISSIVYSAIGSSSLVRCSVEPSGELKLMRWEQKTNNWVVLWTRPSLFCHFYARCGPWGACDGLAMPPTCRCLQGFVPKNRTQWENNNFVGGCVRRTPLQFTKGEKFLLLENTKLPSGVDIMKKKTEAECLSECLSLKQCTAYSYANYTIDPDGYVCLIWRGDLTDLQSTNVIGADLQIRLVASELDETKKLNKVLLLVLLFLGALVVGASCFLLKRGLHLQGMRRARSAMLSDEIYFSDTFRTAKEFPEALFVDFKAILSATVNFSDENKLGQGGFGSVYKGKLGNGQDVAVKRLSRGSKQGQLEFANEVRLIAKLQHKNLVRLLGWCVHKEEKVLLYEYMPNKSLDKLIFGRPGELNLEKRLAIIEGIADGLLYLHHHSRMRVIHRDLKTSNILLDSEMNPKISDFGLAKIIEMNQTEGNTRKVVGTLGYMSPEYALDGVFSEKSDVFSFGVIVLEVISGKRCTGCYACGGSVNLLGYAWKLWVEGRATELIEPAVSASALVNEALKCIHVGLLCIEENAADRPTVNSVVSMLRSEICCLPQPKKPGFRFGRKHGLESHKPLSSSINPVSEMSLEGR